MTGDLDKPDTPLERAVLLQNMIIGFAQNDGLDDEVYAQLRSELLNGNARDLVPDYVRTCRTGQQLWGHLKRIASGRGSWGERRTYVYDTFQPLLEQLERKNLTPADQNISGILSSFDPDGVHRAWERALERRHQDPEGAITAARTLLETVCKRILDEADETYGNDDLPKLYGMTARVLNLAPSQHTEEVFRAILGGCYTIVQNLGSLRNKIGDAHGQGRNPVRPVPRHAALAVNLAGSMATFLVETWQGKRGS